MKKILAVLHTYNEKIGQYFSGTALGQLLSAIILAAAVACATSMVEGLRQERAVEEFYSTIALGNTKEYIEDNLGHPVYQLDHTDYDKITECRYLTKHAMIRVYYDNNMVRAFFITSKDKSYKKIFTMDIAFETKPLGSCTYEMIEGTPSEVQSYQDYRGEFVYYMENYVEPESNDSLLYGYSSIYGFDGNSYTSEDEFRSGEEIQEVYDSMIKLEVEEVVESDNYLFIDRSKSYPNTFGRCAMEDAYIFEYLFGHRLNYY